mgnify:CR=1 FL=1
MYLNCKETIGPSSFSLVQSQREIVYGTSLPKVTRYKLSLERSRHLIPSGWGFKNVLTGVPVIESHTISMESSPLSAVTIQALSSEQAVAVI